jgi:hypothetical protein
VVCDHCGQKNRLPATLAPGKVLVCGACKKPLDEVDDDGEEDEAFDIEGGQE